MHIRITLILVLLFSAGWLRSQSLLDQLSDEIKQKPETTYVMATFKSTRIINGQSMETVGKYGMNIIISHRFGNLNSGVHQFYGLDQSSIRIGLEYGLGSRLDVGLGRSRDEELVDGYVKYKLLRQSTGAVWMPIALTIYSSMQVKAQKWSNPELSHKLSDRFSYVNELIIARKFTNALSVQIVPGFVHRNLTATEADKNLIPYAGLGARYKITNRLSLSSEYYWVYPGVTALPVYNPFAIGIDIETGGHIFQLHFSNSRGMQEKIMIPDNPFDWSRGAFGFGFNIIRNFNFKPHSK
jgi:hypothetical protein